MEKYTLIVWFFITILPNIRCGSMATAEEKKSFYIQKFDDFSFFCDISFGFAAVKI